MVITAVLNRRFQPHSKKQYTALSSPFYLSFVSDNAVLPSRASPLSAGYDLSSAVDTKIPARGKDLVATNLSISIPEGTYARIAPRSGLPLKHWIDVGAGVILFNQSTISDLLS
ncbi:hypothetical protein Ahy_B02g059140 [Arachis hypogaea]|uniref:dUTP diphosphatase n=1 Tax=Arachis hypogaea TaxID=3818 RepID=A0A445AG66_ARAHY|nr:hypothetical protein Ahy_B02g059140 [Arachis hypogaea]